MNEFLSTLLTAVITAAVPVLTTYGIKLIHQMADKAAADASSAKGKALIEQVTNAVADAVAATSQTYVDALKNAGEFTKEAQKAALQKAMDSCLASLTPAAQAALAEIYGDLNAYLTTKIEAEVRAQKLGVTTLIS